MSVTIGALQQFFVKAEATFDTVQAVVTTDAVGLIELKLEPEEAFERTMERVGTASLQGEVARKFNHRWSAVSYVKPAAAGTAPDIGPFLTAAFGTETVVGGTSVTYSLSDSETIGTLQLVKRSGDGYYEVANGAWVETVEVEVTGNDEPKITFSGGYATHGYIYGEVPTTGTHIATATTINLTASTSERIAANAAVRFLDSAGAVEDDNGGAGFTVVSVDYAADTMVITPALSNPLTSGGTVVPFTPAQTLGGTIISSNNSALTIDSTDYGFISSKMTLNTGIHGLNAEADSATVTRTAKADREVECEHQFYFVNTENSILLGETRQGTVRNISTRAGANTAGARMKINTPALRLGVAPVEIPSSEESTYTLSGYARQNSTAADELTLVFD